MSETKTEKPAPPEKKKRASGGRKKKATAPRGKLVIVESPAKAQTIGKYLGRGYTVKASMGHVRDLPKSSLGVDVDNGFTPKYLVPRDKSKVVKDLKESVKKTKEVILATDHDREGEAIAWHLVAATGAEDKPIQRVVFNEITPEAISEAMENPREIDMNLVDAQQARRVLDRLVGYSVSPLLWKKVKRGLSAGRVQTVALRIVVEREKEIEAFIPVESWTVEADLRKHEGSDRERAMAVAATVTREKGEKLSLATESEAAAVLAGLNGASYRAHTVKQRESKRRPQAPFITSTLQQEASRKLGFNVRRTMQIAQQLYEGIDLGAEGVQGLITYMRTDSTNISASAQQTARAVISGTFGPEYVPEKPPVYRKRAKGAQEAHEAIRPTYPQKDPASLKKLLSRDQLRLYTLIWNRFLASQMVPAILDSTTIDIAAGPRSELETLSGDPRYTLRATGSVVRFKGFMAVYTAGRDEGESDELDKGALPPVAEGEWLDLEALVPEQHFTQPPPRFSEASLVKALEEAGIGRPSTYAPTIGTLLARGYVTAESKRLYPTELGFVVSDLLSQNFPDLFNIDFTSTMEGELDEIAMGERLWAPTIEEFYDPFSETLEKAEQSIERVKLKDEPAGEDCEKCGRPMVIKLGRYGKFIACSGFPECRNSRPLLLKIGLSCPKCTEGEVVQRRTKKGRTFFGCSRFPECDFASWSKPVDAKCSRCGEFMVEAGRKGQIKCSSCGHADESLPATG